MYDVQPASDSIYDLIISKAVLPAFSDRQMALEVIRDDAARRYYETVPDATSETYTSTYSQYLYNVSLDACAEYCYDEYASW